MLVLEDAEADRSITLPPSTHCGETVEDLISNIYPNISDPERKPDQWFPEHTIISCKNDDVDHLNSDILGMFPGVQKIMQSAGSLVTDSPDEIQNAMPAEFLNSITVSGLPGIHYILICYSPVMTGLGMMCF